MNEKSGKNNGISLDLEALSFEVTHLSLDKGKLKLSLTADIDADFLKNQISGQLAKLIDQKVPREPEPVSVQDKPEDTQQEPSEKQPPEEKLANETVRIDRLASKTSIQKPLPYIPPVTAVTEDGYRYGEPRPDIEWAALLGPETGSQNVSEKPAPQADEEITQEDNSKPAQDTEAEINQEVESEPEKDNKPPAPADNSANAEEKEQDIAETAAKPAEDLPESPEIPDNAPAPETPCENDKNEIQQAPEPSPKPDTEPDNSTVKDTDKAPAAAGDPEVDDTPPEISPEPASDTPTEKPELKPVNPQNAKKSKIRYICPKCKTPGVRDSRKVGSIVTCQKCGRAMRLTKKK